MIELPLSSGIFLAEMVAFWPGFGHRRERSTALAALQVVKVEAQPRGVISEPQFPANTPS